MIHHIVAATLSLALVATACGRKSDSKDKDDQSESGPGGDGANTGEPKMDRTLVTTDTSEKMSASLVDSGLSQTQIDAVMAAAKAKVDALPADADRAAYFYAFAQGAAQALNEALIGDAKFEDPVAAGKAAASLVEALVTRLYGHPANALLPDEELAKIEKSILEGSVAGLLHLETLETLKIKLEAGSSLALLDTSVAGIGGLTSLNIQNMDLETAMMAIQSQRADLLEGQLKMQLDAVQNRNKAIADLNDWLGKLSSIYASCPGSYNDPTPDPKDPAKKLNLMLQLGQLGLDTKFRGDMPLAEKCSETVAVIEKLKGKIDSLNSSQQMDMLRMQSLTNKRNEAFDLMTNFIKKMSDSRASILGNMRLTGDSDDPVLKTGRAFDARMLAAIASTFVKMTKDAGFTQESLVKLMAVIKLAIGDEAAEARLAEPLGLVGDMLGRDLAGLDLEIAKSLLKSAAEGSFSGAVAAFATNDLAVKLATSVAVGMSKAVSVNPNAAALHAEMAAGHMAALLAVAGKAPGTAENPHAGNDAVRIAFAAFITRLRESLSTTPAVFTAYLDAAKAAATAAQLTGEANEVVWSGLNQMAP